ncbi:hypothetical protein QUA13_22755 [Microcoleus sp. S28C3]
MASGTILTQRPKTSINLSCCSERSQFTQECDRPFSIRVAVR